MDNEKKTNRQDLILFIIFSIIFLFFLLLWLRKEFCFPYWACWDRLIRSLAMYKAIFEQVDLARAFFVTEEYPPFVFFITASGLKICCSSIAVTYGISTLFTLLLCYMLLLTGRLIGGRLLGWSMVLLAGTAPELLFFSRQFFLITPATTMLAISFYLILKSNYFKDLKNSLLSGLAMAIGAYTNFTFMFFIVPVAIGAFVFSMIRGKKEERKKILNNFSWCAFVSIVLPLPWYLGTLESLTRKFRHQMSLPKFHPPLPLENIILNLGYLSQVFYLGGILMIIGLVMAFICPRGVGAILSALGIIGGFSHLPIFRTYPFIRYVIYFIPFAGVLALTWTTLLPVKTRKAILILCIITGLWQAGGWLIPGLPQGGIFPKTTHPPGLTEAPKKAYYDLFTTVLDDIHEKFPGEPPMVIAINRTSCWILSFDGLGFWARERKAYGPGDLEIIPVTAKQNGIFTASRKIMRPIDIVIYSSQCKPSSPCIEDRQWIGNPQAWEKFAGPYIIDWEGPEKLYINLFRRKQPGNKIRSDN
ncbi:MAG: glycosyltransferase family 39 protein [Candidatus Eremiobacteraeota bacterium]|nr:glycosyltransferase family 39 protein [Candidatus Eremiobacteraeota bacterium]